jgi:hypothetical protein
MPQSNMLNILLGGDVRRNLECKEDVLTTRN